MSNCNMAFSDTLSRELIVWGRDLTGLPSLNHGDVTRVAQEFTKTPKNSTNRGYKFFWDHYIHDVQVKPCSEGTQVRAKCFRSMKKNEAPHELKLTLISDINTSIIANKCSCTAGQGFCQHQVALLYQLCHYQSMSMKMVPEIISSTSTLQSWHMPPRTHGIPTRSLTDVKVVAPKRLRDGSFKGEVGVTSKVYNPINEPLSSLNLQNKLLPSISSHSVPTQWLQLWSRAEHVPMTQSNFGDVPKGSLLSYQEKLSQKPLTVGPEKPAPFLLPELPGSSPNTVGFTQNEQVIYASLSVTVDESRQYEEATRKQASCPEWHRLRKNRLTASNFKAITSRKGKFEQLAINLFTKKAPRTKAMQHGIDMEAPAAASYAERYGFDVHNVGFIINPSARHLGCSPDRRVFDPDATPQWGLLEIKCSTKDSVVELDYLKVEENELQLRRSHNYYVQCLGQMGLSGSQWCDFFVMCKNDFHCERIRFDSDAFQLIKEKLDTFYFNFFLPATVKYC